VIGEQSFNYLDSALVPGGVVQLLEVNTRIASDDDSIPKGGYIERYHQAFHQAAEMEGLQHIPPLLAGFLQKAGFVDIAVKVKKGPQGPWPKDPRKKVRSFLLDECSGD
jgi:hypothetical protein